MTDEEKKFNLTSLTMEETIALKNEAAKLRQEVTELKNRIIHLEITLQSARIVSQQRLDKILWLQNQIANLPVMLWSDDGDGENRIIHLKI